MYAHTNKNQMITSLRSRFLALGVLAAAAITATAIASNFSNTTASSNSAARSAGAHTTFNYTNPSATQHAVISLPASFNSPSTPGAVYNSSSSFATTPQFYGSQANTATFNVSNGVAQVDLPPNTQVVADVQALGTVDVTIPVGAPVNAYVGAQMSGSTFDGAARTAYTE